MMKKLSEYKGEEALELLADLIEPMSVIMTDKEIHALFKENRFKAISLAIKKHKDAIIEILAILDGVPVDKYECNLLTLPVTILALLNDKEMLQLFTSAGQMGDATSFASLSENTEE